MVDFEKEFRELRERFLRVADHPASTEKDLEAAECRGGQLIILSEETRRITKGADLQPLLCEAQTTTDPVAGPILTRVLWEIIAYKTLAKKIGMTVDELTDSVYTGGDVFWGGDSIVMFLQE